MAEKRNGRAASFNAETDADEEPLPPMNPIKRSSRKLPWRKAHRPKKETEWR